MRRVTYMLWMVLIVLALGLTGCNSNQALRPVLSPTPTPTMDATEVPPTLAPSPSPTVPTPTPSPTTAPPTPTPSPAATAPPTEAMPGSEILFLQADNLVALDVATRSIRTLAAAVSEMAATPDGRLLALVRTVDAQNELWLVARDGSGLQQMTNDARFASDLSWAPDGQTIAYTSATMARPTLPEWAAWSRWCTEAEVRLLDIASGEEQTLGSGCEPAFSPTGRRLVYATPPEYTLNGLDFRGAGNQLRMLNRQGDNGWDIALSDGAGGFPQGHVLYAPAWSPDALTIAYQRFLGYQTLVDFNLTEQTSSFDRRGEPLNLGAGWAEPPRYGPGNRLVAITEYNFSDARGFTGYDVWYTTLLQLGETATAMMPDRELMLSASPLTTLQHARTVTWSPDGSQLAVLLPPDWKPGLSTFEPQFPDVEAGELWLWSPEADPSERLAQDVAFMSPVLWLPPPPVITVSSAEIALAVPAEWEERRGPVDYRIADGPDSRVLASRLVAGGPPGGSITLFPELILPDATLGEPLVLPDESMVREVRGTTPEGESVTGALRISRNNQVASLYLAPTETWLLDRPFALALLSGL